MNRVKKTLIVLLAVILAISCVIFVACDQEKSNEISNYQSLDYDSSYQTGYNRNLFYTNEYIQGGADPDVLDDTQRSGYYYVYYTGMQVARSKNLVDWEELPLALVPETEKENKIMNSHQWAPEVIYDEDLGKYVMFYSTTSTTDTSYKTGKGVVSGKAYCLMHVALADKAEGPYKMVDFFDADSCGEGRVRSYNTTSGIVLTEEQVASNEYAWVKSGDTYYQAAFPHYFAGSLLFSPEDLYKFLQSYGDLTLSARDGIYVQDSIDPHPFVDPKTGDKYLYFTLNTLQKMVVVKMTDWLTPDFSNAKIIMAKGYYTVEDWQNGKSKEVPYESDGVNEGPHVLYHEDINGKGLYYLTYSMNNYTDSSYQVGIAVAENVLGPYRKLREEEGALFLCSSSTDSYTISGAGHHSFVTVGDQEFVLYHRHKDSTAVGSARYCALDEYKWITVKDINGNDMDVPYTNGPTDSLQPIPEALSDYRNIADEAEVSVSDDEADVSFLIDGLLSVHKSANGTFMEYIRETEISQTSTITFKWDEALTARAIMVYNSANTWALFNKIDLIELVAEDGSVKTIHDVQYNLEHYAELGGENNDIVLYVNSGSAAIVEFYDTKVKEIRLTISVPEHQDYVGISEIKILGKDGEPTYVGDGEYTYTNPTKAVAEVDEGIVMDGEFDEQQWKDARWIKVQDKITDSQYADIQFTMWYGEKGVYFGAIVEETGTNIYYSPNRDSFLNSCIELYMGIEVMPTDKLKNLEIDLHPNGTVSPRLYYVSGLQRYYQPSEIMPICVGKTLGGEINTLDCYGYQLETMIPWEYLEEAGYDVDNKDKLVIGLDPVHIWSYNETGTDLTNDRTWSQWSSDYINVQWEVASSWFLCDKDGMKAYHCNVEVQGDVNVIVEGQPMDTGYLFENNNTELKLNVVNYPKDVIKSITINGKEYDLSKIIWNGSTGILKLNNISVDLDIVIVTEK